MSELDPIEEIRTVRERHTREHGFDLSRIALDIKAGETRLAEEGWTLVRRKRFSSNIVQTIPLSNPGSQT